MSETNATAWRVQLTNGLVEASDPVGMDLYGNDADGALRKMPAARIRDASVIAAVERVADEMRPLADAAAAAAFLAVGPSAIAALLGLPITDFSDARNSVLLTYI